MLIYSIYPKKTINNSVHNIRFVIEWNPFENPTFKNTLKDPFQEKTLKGVLIIPQRLVKIEWWNNTIYDPKTSPSLSLMVFSK